ncbi:MAG: heparinase II/III family protein [Gammaproteobacteria bacterium]
MKKLISTLATVVLAGVAGVASAQFTVPTATYTSTELAAITAALSPTSLTSAIDKFDATTPTMAHPRLFKGQADFAGIAAAIKSERAKSLTALTGYLRRNSYTTASSTLLAQIKSDDNTTRMSSWWQQERMLEGMAEAAVAFYFTKDTWYLTEMRGRMGLFGPAVLNRKCAGDVSETRNYAWYFALAYDFTYSSMTSADRQMVRDVITACGNSGLAKVADTVKAYPENGIAFNALGKFVGALLIVRGEHYNVNAWLRSSLPVYVASVSPWGGDDGGFANGSSYAEWDAGESLIYWDLIERVLGVPFYKKPWLTEFARFIAYALPPGTPAGVFGDGAEVNRAEDWARFGKAIMNRSETTLSRWYVKQQSGEDYARLHIVLSPREYGSAVALPSTQPNGAYFPIVGWAAMHSSLLDRDRTSVFFKSSPFGSINHSHGDQNSFVMYSKGKVLAMDSGHYDYYNSPHWRDYYKQTKAHNAITFDGGNGQSLGATGLGERAAAGKLTKFLQSAEFDITTGDATAAYGGKLTQAKRTVIFIRPSTLVTVDQLNSTTPRKYEYNLHTSVALTGNGGGFYASMAPAELCGSVGSPDPTALTTSSGYFPAPTVAATPHYWNKFSYTTAKNRGLIISVLRSDCSITKPVFSFSGYNATITIAGKVVSVTDTDVTVK